MVDLTKIFNIGDHVLFLRRSSRFGAYYDIGKIVVVAVDALYFAEGFITVDQIVGKLVPMNILQEKI